MAENRPSIPKVSQHLTINVLYSDDDIIVIDKPCDLRSVPGHANPPPSKKSGDDVGNTDAYVHADLGSSTVKSQSQRRTAQEAWVEAIRTLASTDSIVTRNITISKNGENEGLQVSSEEAAVAELLHNLVTTADPSAVPRKLETFVRYCHRNRKRLLPSFIKEHTCVDMDEKPSLTASNHGLRDCSEPSRKKQRQNRNSIAVANLILPMERNIAKICFSNIQQRQRPLLNLPEATEDCESALGQLRMLGFGNYAHCNSYSLGVNKMNCKNPIEGSGENGSGIDVESKLHVIHRLDCQTSGVMVVARNQSAASFLCNEWRERNSVEKIYLAHVRHWPPYHEQHLEEGRIDLPLASSRTERIKWEVRPLESGGKASLTFWKFYSSDDKLHKKDDPNKKLGGNSKLTSLQSTKSGITLELHPLTGRTHQLRIHCAAIGSGIEGDSLYGDSPINWFEEKKKKHPANTSRETLRLHAHKLTFRHPKTGEKVTFASPKPW